MSLRVLFSGAIVFGLLLDVKATIRSTAYGQIRFDTSSAVPETDPIYPILAAHKASIEKVYEDGKSAQPNFSNWVRVKSPAAAQLFPKLQFASISWSERRHPEVKDRAVALAAGLRGDGGHRYHYQTLRRGTALLGQL